MNLLDKRRRAPRISLDGLCGVVSDDDEVRYASMSNLSSIGLCLERPFDARTARPVVQLEIELPGVDEIRVGERRGDLFTRDPDARPRRRWPVSILVPRGPADCDASQRERRLLRDYVVERLIQVRRASDRRDLRFDRREQQ